VTKYKETEATAEVSGIIGLVVVIVLAAVVGWLTVRSWRSRNMLVRYLGSLVAALVTLVLAAISVIGLVGVYRLNAPHGAPAANITVQASPDQIAEAGKRASGCAACHSSTGSLPLDGGARNFLGGGGPPLGVLVPPNLTPGGPLKDWSDGEIIRAIREGVDRDGHPMMIMPSDSFHNLSDTDVQALVAFLRSQPPSAHATSPRDVSLLGLALVGAGLFPTAEQPHISQPQSAPAAGVTPEYGKYLVDITGCRLCHGANLEGRAPGGFGPPAGPNLHALVPTWQEAAFVNFFRTGMDPYGRNIGPDLMPWADIGKAYSDDNLRAIYAYLLQPT
jgi:mono/diheme cytochrome c family protein